MCSERTRTTLHQMKTKQPKNSIQDTDWHQQSIFCC